MGGTEGCYGNPFAIEKHPRIHKMKLVLLRRTLDARSMQIVGPIQRKGLRAWKGTWQRAGDEEKRGPDVAQQNAAPDALLDTEVYLSC